MQFGQTVRQLGASMRRGLDGTRRRLAEVDRSKLRRWTKRIAIGVVVALALYYPTGMLLAHKIDDNIAFTVQDASLAPGSSRSVAIVSALIDREVNRNGWVANEPFFVPSSQIDNMPNYQMGMMAAFANFAFEVRDQIGRTRGSSQADVDLSEAAGLLQYPGTRWVWDPSVSLLPTAPAEEQYRAARQALDRYNRRLAEGEAVFDRRADNLQATLNRIALDVGSASAALDERIENAPPFFPDRLADDRFYNVKGGMYGYYMILRELRSDFGPLIQERELSAAYDQMLGSFEKAARLQPMVVVNGRPDGQFLPNHLAAQGFFLLRARTQLRELTSILEK